MKKLWILALIALLALPLIAWADSVQFGWLPNPQADLGHGTCVETDAEIEGRQFEVWMYRQRDGWEDQVTTWLKKCSQAGVYWDSGVYDDTYVIVLEYGDAMAMVMPDQEGYIVLMKEYTLPMEGAAVPLPTATPTPTPTAAPTAAPTQQPSGNYTGVYTPRYTGTGSNYTGTYRYTGTGSGYTGTYHYTGTGGSTGVYTPHYTGTGSNYTGNYHYTGTGGSTGVYTPHYTGTGSNYTGTYHYTGTGSNTGAYTNPGSGQSGSSSGLQLVEIKTACWRCHGTGTCQLCHGTGTYHAYGSSIPCNTKCDVCGGTGSLTQLKLQ